MIVALDMTVTADAGWPYDSAFGCMSMCMLWSDGCYFIPYFRMTGLCSLSKASLRLRLVRVTGRCARTNNPPNTAMRAPGVVNVSCLGFDSQSAHHFWCLANRARTTWR